MRDVNATCTPSKCEMLILKRGIARYYRDKPAPIPSTRVDRCQEKFDERALDGSYCSFTRW